MEIKKNLTVSLPYEEHEHLTTAIFLLEEIIDEIGMETFDNYSWTEMDRSFETLQNFVENVCEIANLEEEDEEENEE